MPRSKENLSQETDPEEKVHLAQIKLDAALLNVDTLTLYKKEVNNQIKLSQDNTNKQELQMKLPNFLGRKIDNIHDYQESVSSRSRSVSRKREKISTQQPTWTRVQSLDRERKDDAPTLSFLCLRCQAGDQRTDPQKQWL